MLPELGALLRRPLITLERVRVCKRDGELARAAARPSRAPTSHGMAMWQKLMIYTSEGALHDGQPVHRAIVQRLRRSGARGATALRGVWGFAGEPRARTATACSSSADGYPCSPSSSTHPERIAGVLRDRRRAHRRARRGDQRDGPGAGHGQRTGRHGGLGLARHPY